MSKDSTQTSTTNPDTNTANYQDLWRKTLAGLAGGITGSSALNGAGNGTTLGASPYQAVIDAMKQNFAAQRAQVGQQADSYATQEGAYGGNRSAILKNMGMNSVNQNENSSLANLGVQQSQDQWSHLLSLLGLMGGASSVGGTVNTQQMPSNGWGTALGGLATLGGIATGGGGTVAGDLLGL